MVQSGKDAGTRSESSIQRSILSYLKQFWAVKVIISNQRGCPDIIACIDGRFVAIECKSATGKLSAVQSGQKKLIEKAGGLWITARTIDDVKQYISPLLNPAALRPDSTATRVAGSKGGGR